MNRVLRCIQALGTIKCIPLTCSIGQGGMEEEWNWARRQAWTSHHLWFPKQREFGKGSPHFPVPSGHNSLQPEQLLKIRRRRRKWKRQKRNRLDTRTKQTNKQTKSASAAHSFSTFLWCHCKAATWYLNLDMVLTNSSPETFPYIWQSTWVGTKRLWRLNEREFTF